MWSTATFCFVIPVGFLLFSSGKDCGGWGEQLVGCFFVQLWSVYYERPGGLEGLRLWSNSLPETLWRTFEIGHEKHYHLLNCREILPLVTAAYSEKVGSLFSPCKDCRGRGDHLLPQFVHFICRRQIWLLLPSPPSWQAGPCHSRIISSSSAPFFVQ